jgi:hypothetical protein
MCVLQVICFSKRHENFELLKVFEMHFHFLLFISPLGLFQKNCSNVCSFVYLFIYLFGFKEGKKKTWKNILPLIWAMANNQHVGWLRM